MRQRVDRTRLRQFLRTLGGRVRRPVRFYLVGGGVLIDLGLRATTVDIDFVAEADDPRALDELEVVIRQLKNEMDLSIEPASPADFLPIPSTAVGRSRYVGTFGSLSVYYYDLASLVIAKAARGLERDLDDVERLVRAGQVAWQEVEERWGQVRSSPTGWLRHEPDEVEQRLELLRRRLRTEAADDVR